MKTICLYFQVHQPFRFRRYRFFDIGNDHYYYDDYMNESIMQKVATKCYLPANKVLLKLIKEYGANFRISFSISGIALDQFELYAPEVLESFQALAATGSVEFLSETSAHSLASLRNRDEFQRQVEVQNDRIFRLFGQRPTVFRNTELIYSDQMGSDIADMGFKAMLTEGAKHIIGWKSPNYLYCNAINPRLKVLLRNFKLSDDIAFRFGNQTWSAYPLTTEKFVGWLNKMDPKEETANIFIDYETFGEHQWKETGIFDFLKALPKTVFRHSKFKFATPSEVADQFQPVSAVNVPNPISWADEERDLTAWLGNELQQEAYNKLYELAGKIASIDDPKIMKDWKYLQASDHFYYMSTKFFSDGEVHAYFNPYASPYDAFINYMNILSDFSIRVNAANPKTDKEVEIANLTSVIEQKNQLIQKYEQELLRLKTRKSSPRKSSAGAAKTAGTSKTTAKKTTPKKAKAGGTTTKKTATKKSSSGTRKK
ncbi:MAG TPA: glycoside hydrolase family 57 protein [Bacteroidales bacterium]|nr:glycoside hydrolase family 57 protein [Bacteroidales bacterium]